MPPDLAGPPRVLVDHVGMVAEFLNEVDLIDVVVELIQNELDAGSPHTEIALDDDKLVCAGAGNSMDPKGWERLGYVLGAGALVEAKIDGIGSKNHGIRACFLLGDRIIVQSDGLRVDLTAKGDPDDPERFYPAGWERVGDPGAPETGVRVIVPMRKRDLPVVGHNPLTTPTPEMLDALFEEAAQSLPERFLTASAPGKPWRYDLVLRRGARNLTLSYEAIPAGAGEFTLRTCRRSEGGRPGRIVSRRACHSFLFTPAEDDAAKVPRLFRDAERILSEICWTIDASGNPSPSAGTYRYPIALPAGQAGNPYGFDVSGPFVTGKSRHSLGNDRRNRDLLKASSEAFVALMRKSLVPKHGASALTLLQSTGSSDPQQLATMAGALLEAGALPLHDPSSRKKHHSTTSPGAKLLLASPSFRQGELDPTIAFLGPDNSDFLDCSSPLSVVLALRRWARDNGGVEDFDEIAAARTVTVDEAPAAGERGSRWLERCVTAFKLLDQAKMAGTLDTAALAQIKADGWLPADDGRACDWLEIRQSDVNSLRIPGVEPPLLLHQKLKSASVLRRGEGVVTRFELDKFLSGLDFQKAGQTARLAFFRWLRKNHNALPPKTLARIANNPIWPDTDGTCRTLAEYCVPRKPYLRNALAEVLAMPAEQVSRFPGLKSSSNAALRLRLRPHEGELRTWHQAAIARIANCEDPAAAAEAIRQTEAVLEQMREDGYHPRGFAENHLTLDRDSRVRPIQELHVESEAVKACELLPQDLLPPGRRTLHSALGANDLPLPEAVLRAMREDPDRHKLAARLVAYRNAGRALHELSGEPIVREHDDVLAPNTLAFALPVDHWGDWKRRISLTDASPEEAKLLEEAGVVRAPREDTAREFFAWIATKPPVTIAKHRPQIIRLWLDRRASPTKWHASFPHLPCVLLRDRNKAASLVQPRVAAGSRSQIFLPDLRSIERAVLKDHPRLRLAIVDSPGVDGSALNEVASAGVKSLAAEVGPPRSLTLVGEAREDPALNGELDRIRSTRVRNHLRATLPRHGVPSEALDRRWRSTLQETRAVQVAAGLEATYQFGRKTYSAPISSGYDIATGQVCVAEANATTIDLYDAIAQRIFVPRSPATYSHGLIHAVRELSAASSSRTLFDDLKGSQDADEADPGDPGGQPAGGNAQSPEGDNRKGHGAAADAKPFVPSPKSLPKITTLTFPKGNGPAKKRRASSQTEERRHSIEEDAQIQKLKHDHYAVHCQACIGTRDVLEAAPPESYVYSPSYRRLLIQAHHVKLLVNQPQPKRRSEVAGQGAGNLLILCRYHHALLGDQLSRPAIVDALQQARPITRHFPDKAGKPKAAAGLLATVKIPTEPHHVAIYFTRQHAEAWMDY